MTIFDDLAPVAQDLIDELDTDIVVEERTLTADKVAGTSEPSTTDRAAKAALKGFRDELDEETRRRVTRGTVVVPAGYLPNGAALGWKVYLAATKLSTEEYQIVAAERRPKRGTAIVYLLEVQR